MNGSSFYASIYISSENRFRNFLKDFFFLKIEDELIMRCCSKENWLKRDDKPFKIYIVHFPACSDLSVRQSPQLCGVASVFNFGIRNFPHIVEIFSGTSWPGLPCIMYMVHIK